MKRLGYNGEGESKGGRAWKKARINLEARTMVVGGDPNLTLRHSISFASLLALIPQRKHRVFPEGKLEVLQRTNYSSHIYLEWNETEDRYFLWGTVSPEKLVIKFEYHGGIDKLSDKLGAKKPKLLFSSSFGQDLHWNLVKKFFCQYFGCSSDGEPDRTYDYQYVFTRIGDLVHLRVFKLDGPLDMQQISPSFILKPLSTYILSQSDEGVKELMMVNLFFDDKSLMRERKGNLHLQPHQMLCDSLDLMMIPHEVVGSQDRVMIPPPADPSQWIGFNTSCSEFFDRYHVSRVEHVLGTGPNPKPWPQGDPTPNANRPVENETITKAMKIFSRSLILCVGERHKMGLCFGDFTEDNIFLKGGQASILNVQLLPFEMEQAKSNFYCTHKIIYGRLQNHCCSIPPDINFVLDLLKTDPIGNYDLVVNSFAWMFPTQRSDMMGDIVRELYKLHPDKQVQLGRLLPDFQLWEEKFEANWLLYDCLVGKKAEIGVNETIANWKQKLARKRRNLANKKSSLLTDPADATDLQESIEYAGGIRNCYIHLWESVRRKNLRDIEPNVVDAIISSQLAEPCCTLQQVVPKELKVDSELSSYKGFARYFPAVDLSPGDKKA